MKTKKRTSKKAEAMATFGFTIDPDDVQGALGEVLGHALVMSLLQLPAGVSWKKFEDTQRKLRSAMKPIVARSKRLP